MEAASLKRQLQDTADSLTAEQTLHESTEKHLRRGNAQKFQTTTFINRLKQS
jgi:hypothetical protein